MTRSKKSKTFSSVILQKEEMQLEKKGKFPPFGICKRTNHLESDRRGIGMPQCNHCKWFGHTKKVCKRKRNQEQAQAQVSEEVGWCA